MTARAALLALVVLMGFTVESALGFGATVVTVTLGSMLLPVDAILASFVPVNVLLSLVLVARNARSVDRRLLAFRIVPWMGLGLPLGFYVGRTLDPRVLKLIFGCFVVLLSSVELWGLRRTKSQERDESEGTAVDDTGRLTEEKPAASPLPGWVSALLLTLGGVVHGAFATGGPMAVYVSGRLLPDKARFRATLSALWLVLNLALLAGYVARGAVNSASLTQSVWMLAALPVGVLFGDWLHKRVPLGAFRVAINVMLLGIGCVLIVRR